MRLIDADVLIDHLLEVIKTANYFGNTERVSEINGCIGVIKSEKTIEIPRGKWIEGFDGHFETLNCNKCGYSKPSTHYEFNFCPNCGVPITEEAFEIIRKREGDQNETYTEASKDS